MKYSVQDIIDMRDWVWLQKVLPGATISAHLKPGQGGIMPDMPHLPEIVERELLTYMANETTLGELRVAVMDEYRDCRC